MGKCEDSRGGRQLTASVARVQDILSYEIDLATQDSDGNLPLLLRLLDLARVLASTESENLDSQRQLALKGEVSRLDSVTELLAGKSDSGSKEKDAKDCKKPPSPTLWKTFWMYHQSSRSTPSRHHSSVLLTV